MSEVLPNLKSIFARSANEVFGTHKGVMPWSGQKADIDFLKQTVYDKNVIIGRTTYKTAPKSLFNNVNRVYVLTSQDKVINTKQTVKIESIEAIIKEIKHKHNETFVCLGGFEVFKKLLPRSCYVYETCFNFNVSEDQAIYLSMGAIDNSVKETINLHLKGLDGVIKLHYLE